MSNQTIAILGAIWGFLALTVLGVGCTIFPHTIQKWARKKRFGPVLDPALYMKFTRDYMQSSRYIRDLRVTGIAALLVAACLLWFLADLLLVHLRG